MVPNAPTTESTVARGPDTIATLFAEWLECYERGFDVQTEEDSQANHKRYMELQATITDLSPVTAQDLAMQILVETDHGNSEWRDGWFARLVALAKRPTAPQADNEREAKFEAALAVFRKAAQEYDPTILSAWVSWSEWEPGDFSKVNGVWFNRSRKTEENAARARGEIA